jgi:hypothetical protein
MAADGTAATDSTVSLVSTDGDRFFHGKVPLSMRLHRITANPALGFAYIKSATLVLTLSFPHLLSNPHSSLPRFLR